MSDRVLQLVIASLQHKWGTRICQLYLSNFMYRLPNMLWNARGEKKHKVHVERGGESVRALTCFFPLLIYFLR